MNADGPQLGGTLVEKFLLGALAAIGFLDHEFNSHLLGGDYARNKLAHRWFEQGKHRRPALPSQSVCPREITSV
jgi:hypothetical protein